MARNGVRDHRIAVDTGGTFTDLVVEEPGGALCTVKRPTTPDRPVRAVIEALGLAAAKLGMDGRSLLESTSLFVYATTHAINAVLTGTTARTGLVVTAGHRDVLTLREGKRANPFDTTVRYPEPYVPRYLTVGVTERTTSRGTVLQPLDEASVVEALRTLAGHDVEAVAVCLLWSILDPAHETRVGQLIEDHLPGVPYTLSHQLNPIVREYRRASSAAIDASLKPEMSAHLTGLQTDLVTHGFGGRLLVVSSIGGVLDVEDIAGAPIHCLGSGPAMAPVAARHYAGLLLDPDRTLIVADTGGTSYDVSVVRGGRIPRSSETWLGERSAGYITGFPSIDVTSIGAGGGSIAWVDSGGLLHVGPQSAGSVPGPACYGRGGELPTVTDACLCLGYLNPTSLADDAIRPDVEAARAAVRTHVADRLGVDVLEASAAVLQVATEHMIGAIQDVTLSQGVDTEGAALVAGGGAGGLNAGAIGRRLGCSSVIIPRTSSTLSAVGALLADLSREFAAATILSTAGFDQAEVRGHFESLRHRCAEFAAGAVPDARTISYRAVARYRNQVWDLEVPVEPEWFTTEGLPSFVAAFHRLHAEHFAVTDEESPIVVTQLLARVDCRLRPAAPDTAVGVRTAAPTRRTAYFNGSGPVELAVETLDALPPDRIVHGPAVIEGPLTTIVIDADSSARRTIAGDVVIDLARSRTTARKDLG